MVPRCRAPKFISHIWFWDSVLCQLSPPLPPPCCPGSWQPLFYSQLLWLKLFGLGIGVKSCSTCLSGLGLAHLLCWCPVLPKLLQMTAFHWIFTAEDCAVVIYYKGKHLRWGLGGALVCGCNTQSLGLGFTLCLFSRVIVFGSSRGLTAGLATGS